MAGVRRLDLSWNRLGANAAEALARSVHLRKLEELRIAERGSVALRRASTDEQEGQPDEEGEEEIREPDADGHVDGGGRGVTQRDRELTSRRHRPGSIPRRPATVSALRAGERCQRRRKDWTDRAPQSLANPLSPLFSGERVRVRGGHKRKSKPPPLTPTLSP